MKKTVAVMICVLSICCLFSGCLFEDPADLSASTNPALQPNGEQAVVPDQTLAAVLYDNDIAQLNLFGSDQFYFKGTITDAEGTTPMEVASMNGNTFMASSMDGIAMGFMHIGEDYYMLYPDGECALKLDDAVCKTLDMDPSEMDFDPAKLSLGEVSDDYLVNVADALVDTTLATCRTYAQPSGNYVKTYISDGQLIRMQAVTADGIVTTTMDVEILTNVVPAEKAGLPANYKVYSGNVGMMSFMMKFASNVDIDSLTN